MNYVKQKGFTIVELLIVIVVIAILAAISVVAYNGIQSRAENAKTVAAVTSWVKALQMYRLDTGSYPSVHSCLGDTSTYTDSHNGRCWGTNTDGTWVVSTTFLSQMSPYLSTYPAPSNKDVHANSGGNQYRGAMYYRYGAGAERIYVQILGISGSYTNCPDISGLGPAFSGASRTNGYSCYYNLPQ